MMLSSVTLMLSLAIQASAATEEQKPLPDRTSFLIEFQVKRPGIMKAFMGPPDPIRASQYTYTEKVTELELDKKGKIKSSQTDIFHIIPTRLPGYTYRRQLVKHGVALTPAELDKQDRKHEQDLAKAEADRHKWREESARRKAEARKKFQAALARDLDKQKLTGEERRRREEEAMKAFDTGISGQRPANAPPPKMEDSSILQALDFQLVRREVIDGYSTLLLSFKPRVKYKPTDDVTKILYHTEGRVWVSEDDYEVVKIEAHVIDPISFGLGLLAKVQAGSMGVFEWRKVNDEIWMPSKEDFTAKVRILLVKGQHAREIHEYSDHKKYVVNTELKFGVVPVSP
jgi:hypothetical protein